MRAKTIILPLVIIATLSACNTIRGMGEDIEATGDAISGTASETKREMNK